MDIFLSVGSVCVYKYEHACLEIKYIRIVPIVQFKGHNPAVRNPARSTNIIVYCTVHQTLFTPVGMYRQKEKQNITRKSAKEIYQIEIVLS